MPDQALVQDSLVGLELGHYRILQRIGSGGMGVVYRGYDAHLEREVAVKVLNPGTIVNDASRKRFRNEARALSKLNHPSVATVHDFDTLNGQDFLVMEYIEGVNLADRLAFGPLPEDEVVYLGEQLCNGLSAAHSHGVVHSDLKPGNLRLTADGRLKILDFGLAKLRQPFLPEVATASTLGGEAFTGTLPYMAPEQLTGDIIDARTDIYAAGLVLYEMTTGQRPYAELHDAKLFGAILHHPPIPPGLLNPKASPELGRIIEKCLEKDASKRYPSADELKRDLLHLAAGAHTGADVGQQAGGVLPPTNRHKKWMRAGMVIAILLGIGFGLRLLFPAWFSSLSGPAIPQVKQVAVLPFAVMDGDGETAALGAGLTETITAKLTQLTRDPHLQVVPSAEMRVKRIATADQARTEFGVNLALGGSLHKSGNQMRINCVLEDTRTRRQIRARSLTVTAGDAFAVEDAVVNGAMEMLGLDARLRPRGNADSSRAQAAGAYDYYVQGIGYLQNYDREGNLDSAIEVFQHALALDKNYAPAYAGLGEAYWQKYLVHKQPEWLKKSQDACQMAGHLDDQLPAAHTCLGTLFARVGNYAEAVNEFSQVLESEPTNDGAYRGLASAYEHLGRLREAENTFKRAIALRPNYWATYNWLGVFYYNRARFREASDMFRQAVALAPDSVRGYYNLAASSMEEARYDDAIKASERSIAIQPSAYGYTNLGSAYFFLKRYEDALLPFEQATRFSEKDPLVWLNLGDGYYWAPGRRKDAAAAYQKCAALAAEELQLNPKDSGVYGMLAICQAMLGLKNVAVEALNQGLHLAPEDATLLYQAALIYNQFDEREETLRWLARYRVVGHSQAKLRDCPNFEPLRSDPRFQELLRAK